MKFEQVRIHFLGDDGNIKDNENGKKRQQIGKTTSLHVHHACTFLCRRCTTTM